MPILERIDKAEWLAEKGSVLEAEKELLTAKTQISLIKLKIQVAYSAIPPRKKESAAANEGENESDER